MHVQVAGTLIQTVTGSPIGPLRLTSNGTALVSLVAHVSDASPGGTVERDALLEEACAQLEAYFDDRLTRFDVPLAPAGTEFQRRVWDALRAIPFGETTTYSELAGITGNRRAVRAVGAASSRNPIMIITPCHRVVGTDGSLTGFSAGIERKRWLLEHEARGAVT